jgi:hypothetical protein
MLREEVTEMKAVVVNAGSFEASDRKRTTVLKSLDLVTIAGQQADLVAALKTLPGAQQVGEQEGLFVRGGTGTETKVHIDGLLVSNPFFSAVPGISQRSRFSPLLFKGTVFSSGGYSAEYGQALSSVLLLESIDLPARSEINLIVSSAQQSILSQRLNKKKSGSAGLSVNYTNLSPYYEVIRQKYNHQKAPEIINAELNLRQKTKRGFFKFYAYSNYNEIEFSRDNLNYYRGSEFFDLRNQHVFANTTYTGRIGKSWSLYSGAAYTYNRDRLNLYTAIGNARFQQFSPISSTQALQARVVATKNLPGLSRLNFGAEKHFVTDKIFARDSIDKRKVSDQFTAVFAEANIYFSNQLAVRAGLRFEKSCLLDEWKLVPRTSIAYKWTGKSQFSYAFGIFYQKPESAYMLVNKKLGFTGATHHILNFQRVHNNTTLRIEAFYKLYKKLIVTTPSPLNISNSGSGYARGLELFWRDRHSIKNLDYWISYSFLDTRRKFLDYPGSVQPSFVAKHTANLVAKRFVSKISTQFSLNYNYASGRPFYNPERSEKEFMTDRTIAYHSLAMQLNYLRSFGTVNAVFIINISNVFGWKQVFGYRYSSQPDVYGNYQREKITPLARRFIFLGIYLSIGSDRRKEILD